MVTEAQASEKPFKDYLPWVVLVFGLVVTISTWRTMATHERVGIGWATQLAAEAIRADLIEDTEWQRIGLDRLALLWAAAAPTQRLWTQNAELYIEHRPGCVAVEWVASDGDKRAVVTPLRTNPMLAFDGYPQAAIEAAKNSRTTTLSAPETLADGSSQYAVTQPVYDASGQLLGFVIAFFDVARSIRENLSDVGALGFSFAVVPPGQAEYVLPGTRREHEQDWGITVTVPLPGVTWQLRVWPNPDAFNRIKSALPQVTLALGTLLSFLAFLTLYFASGVARSNKALQREIAVREGAEKELRRAHDELDTRVHERTAELATANILLQKEVTEHERAEDSLRELTGRVFRMQDEERRRLARELHDGATQNLVALAIDVAAIRDAIPPEDTCIQERVSGCARRVRQCTDELRTLSYLLHPPLLSELGLASALRDFAQGFATRSGIETTVNIDPNLGRFEPQLELAIFRVVQEALSNVHRHAHSRTAGIALMRHPDFLQLEITDAGRGIPSEVLAKEGSKLVGVGIAGMRERVRLLGGTLDIQSGSDGTRIQVVLPVSFLSVRKDVAKADRAAAGEFRAVA